MREQKVIYKYLSNTHFIIIIDPKITKIYSKFSKITGNLTLINNTTYLAITFQDLLKHISSKPSQMNYLKIYPSQITWPDLNAKCQKDKGKRFINMEVPRL